MKKTSFFILTFILHLGMLNAQTDSPLYIDEAQMEWVNEKYNSLTLDEKVGQLFVIAAYSNKDTAHENEIENLVRDEQIGGLIFMQDVASRQAELNNRFNASAKIPLLIGMDAEWGLAMRLKGVERYPWAMTLGAIQDNNLIEEMGQCIGEQANRMGVHFNFSPAVDVNTNPLNPIIGNRSFGSDVENITQKGLAYMNGMKKHGVLSSAKHFPGHGDTSQDSHHVLPVINHDITRLKSVELATFQNLIDAGVASVMISHLNVPALDDSGTPASISKKIVTDLLKNEMNFKGIVITDALNMDGVAKGRPVGDVELQAFEAGNDILLFAQNVRTAKKKILDKLNSGDIPMSRLEESVKKILMTKYLVGLNNPKPINPEHVLEDLNDSKYHRVISNLYRNAATLIKNEENSFPIVNYSDKKIAYVPLGKGDWKTFENELKPYGVQTISVSSAAQISKLKGFDAVIIGSHKTNKSVYDSYKFSAGDKSIIKAIGAVYPTTLVMFGSPYGLIDTDVSSMKSILVMYQNLDATHKAAALAIFGKIGTNGKLPADVNNEWKFGKGITTIPILQN